MGYKLCYNKKIKSFREAISYLESLEKFGIKFGLKRVRQVCAYLGNPQDKLKIVHVAGTNGKGSVCAFISSILRVARYKTGLYTSPHLVDVRERFQLNSHKISKKDLVGFLEQIRLATDNLEIKLTYFEALTILAFLYFEQEQVEVAILEVGMGGRLDATNVIKSSLATVITNVDFDHTQYLGKTLEAIAREKAGIIKPDGVVVTAVTQSRVLNIIKQVCQKNKCTLWQTGESIEIPSVKLGLRGDHQLQNAACAIGAIQSLRLRGFSISNPAIESGLRRTVWPGRLEVQKLRANNGAARAVLLDGAHNPAGAVVLSKFLQSKTVKYRQVILIFGVLKDKDYCSMIKSLSKVSDKVILVRPKSMRALSPALMYAQWSKEALKENIFTVNNTRKALTLALDLAEANDLVCVTGSLYLVGEMRTTIKTFNGEGDNQCRM